MSWRGIFKNQYNKIVNKIVTINYKIYENLINYPELQEIIGIDVNDYMSYIKLENNNNDIKKEILQKMFSAFMSRPVDETLAPLTSLISRIKEDIKINGNATKEFIIKDLICRYYFFLKLAWLLFLFIWYYY